MIKVYSQNDRAFVWNADDVMKLRTEHRIIGSLTGCFPRMTFQNIRKWLPLQLMPEEVKVLLDKGVINFVTNPAVENGPSSETVELYLKARSKLCDEQIEKFKEARMKTIMEKADEILKGKKMKLSEGFEHKNVAKKRMKRQKKAEEEQSIEADTSADLDRSESPCNVTSEASENTSMLNVDQDVTNDTTAEEPADESMRMDCGKPDDSDKNIPDSSFESNQGNDRKSDSADQDLVSSSCNKGKENLETLDSTKLVEEEIAKLPNVGHETCMVQLHTECIWKKDEDDINATINFPKTEQEKLRYAVFKDLWEKGYYLTSGLKFGGDFLVYAGDPVKYHALYIVFCIDREQNFYAKDVVTFGRVSNQVKKTLLLSSVTSTGSVEHLSISWASDMVVSRKQLDPSVSESVSQQS